MASVVLASCCMKHPWFLGNYPAACWIEEKLELDNPAGDKEGVLGRIV